MDGRLAHAVMAIQAIKGVEIGLGFEAARRVGSDVHDPIEFDPDAVQSPTLGYHRPTNNAGGLEAGDRIALRDPTRPVDAPGEAGADAASGPMGAGS